MSAEQSITFTYLPSDRDWSDVGENANYINLCSLCRQMFSGNKHRVVCRVCTEKAASETESNAPDRCPTCGSDDKAVLLPRHNPYNETCTNFAWHGLAAVVMVEGQGEGQQEPAPEPWRPRFKKNDTVLHVPSGKPRTVTLVFHDPLLHWNGYRLDGDETGVYLDEVLEPYSTPPQPEPVQDAGAVIQKGFHAWWNEDSTKLESCDGKEAAWRGFQRGFLLAHKSTPQPQPPTTAQTGKTLAQTIAEIIMVDSDEFDGSIHAYLIDGFAMSGKRDYAEQHRLADLACEKITQAAIAFAQSDAEALMAEVQRFCKEIGSKFDKPIKSLSDVACFIGYLYGSAQSSRTEQAGTTSDDLLRHLKLLVDFAHEQGFHEIGYDPVEEVRKKISLCEQASNGEMPSVEELLLISNGKQGEEPTIRQRISAVREACMRVKAPVVSPGWESIIAVEITPELREFARQGIIIDSVMQARGNDEWELGQIAARRLVTRLKERAEAAEQTIADLRGENARLTEQSQSFCNQVAEIRNDLTAAREQMDLCRKHEEECLESDSVVASCNCPTKTDEVRFHKPGCKYRLIMERDESRESLREVEEELGKWQDKFNTEHATAIKALGELDGARQTIHKLQYEAQSASDEASVLRKELASLKASSGWVSLSERKPTKEDADDLERVLWRLKGNVCEPAPFDVRRSSAEWFWHPMSPLPTPPPSPEEQERWEFEKWANRLGLDMSIGNEKDRYSNYATDWSWSAWQAARAPKGQP